MNIREHIEAGHYERDDQGRPLVPTKSSVVAVILATDLPGSWPIVGHVNGNLFQWNENGYESRHYPGLEPPPPRKVKVTRWALLTRDGSDTQGFTNSARQASEWRATERCPVVELTGEMEVPFE